MGLVSDYHIREGDFLNIHCTQLAEFSNIIDTNVNVNPPRNWYSYSTECSEDDDLDDLEDLGLAVLDQNDFNRRIK